MIYQYGANPALQARDEIGLSQWDVVQDRKPRSVVGIQHYALTTDVASVPSTGDRSSIESVLFRTEFTSGYNTYLAIDLNVTARIDTTAATGAIPSAASIHIYVDGLPHERYGMLHSTKSNHEAHVSLLFDYFELGAGYHVLEVKWSTNNGVSNATGGGTAACNAASDPYAHGCSVTIVEYA